MKDRFRQMFEFITFAEKLKTELRHSWTSDRNRQESVAEHTWMMSLIALLLFEEVEISLDKLKVLKMIIVHDLVEVFAHDIPSFEIHDIEKRQQDERNAIVKLIGYLPNKKVADEILDLFEEFEAIETPEAKFAKAIDKSEVLIMHNIAKMDTWSQGDYDLALYAKDHLYNFDPVIRQYKDAVDGWTMEKVESEGDVSKLKAEEVERFKLKINN